MREPHEARLPETAPPPGQRLVFVVADRTFAVSLEGVVEVMGARPATPLPGCPPEVEGIVTLRGRIVTLVDARRRLGLPARGPGERAHVIVVARGGALLGLVVDAVSRVGAAPDAAPAELDALFAVPA